MTAEGARETTREKETNPPDDLGTGNWQLRKAAVGRWLQTPSDPAAKELLQMLREEHRNLARTNAAIEVLAHTAIDVVPGLLELLAQADADLRCYVALTLGQRGDPRAIAPLIERLSDGDTNVRCHAIEALGTLRTGAAVDALIALVEEQNFELAFPALDALKTIGDCRIAHRLLPLLNQSLYKQAAIEAIGELGDEEVIRPLLDRFQDADVPPIAIGIALANMQERHETRYGVCEFIPGLVRGMTSPAAVQAFLATVVNDVPDPRLATVLSWLPGDEIDCALASLLERFPFENKVIQAVARRGNAIGPLLTERLSGASPEGRGAIIEVLLRVANRDSIPALLEIVEAGEDDMSVVRALEALSRLSEPRLYQAALKHFGHPSARIRQAAVAAVGCAGRESAVQDLQSLWSSGSPLERESVLRAAAYLGDSEVVEIVIAGCTDPDDQVRRTAIEQLATIDDNRASQFLQVALRSDNPLIRAAAITATSRANLDPAVAAALIESALSNSDVWVRYFAIRAMIALGCTTQHLSQLIALSEEESAMQVRIAAIEALGQCGEHACDTLLKVASSPVNEVAEAAVLSLARTGHSHTISVLTQWLDSSSDSKRRKAIEALGVLRTSQAVEILERIALGPDQQLSIEAVRALGRIPLATAASALVETLAWPRRREVAMQALMGLPAVAGPVLKSGLSHESLDVRRAAVETLARIRTPAAMEVLELALGDRSAAVRHAALTALAHLNVKKAAWGADEQACGGCH